MVVGTFIVTNRSDLNARDITEVCQKSAIALDFTGIAVKSERFSRKHNLRIADDIRQREKRNKPKQQLK